MGKSIIEVAKGQAEAFGVRNIIVPTWSGKSARLVRQAFAPTYRVIAVGNLARVDTARRATKRQEVNWTGVDISYEACLGKTFGVTPAIKQSLEENGIEVVLADQSLVQTMPRCFETASFSDVIDKAGRHKDFHATAIVYHVLQLFDNGPRVCIETMLMAADSGVLPLNKDCLTIVRTPGDSPDVAMVMHPVKTNDLFNVPYIVVDLAMVHDEH